jgi:GntR family transcriptional regulator, transcriptional repressor for pyruvate dehydrogenase complex
MATVANEAGKSLVAKAMDAVKVHIRESRLRVGDTLPGEGYFAEKLGVSRAVIREAFGGLAALRLIDVANGRRAKVGALDGSVIAASLDHALSTAQINVADVWDVRRTIEMRTAALAARNATQDQASRIVALAEAMSHDDQPHDQTTEEDINFHLAIAEASGNDLFNQIVASFVPLMRVAVPQAWNTRRTNDDRRVSLDRHKKLAWAIANHDPREAEHWMAAHFDESIGMLLRTGHS